MSVSPSRQRTYEMRQVRRAEQLERDMAAIANANKKPAYDGSECLIDETYEWCMSSMESCPWGTRHCVLMHDGSDPIPAEVLKEREEAAKERREKSHVQD